MSTVLKIENLYKQYRLGVIGRGTLYRDMQSWWAKFRGKEDPNTILGHTGSRFSKDNILALKNINLDISSGEVVGIIGGNGAGKSTLLKILSRITTPTKGIAKIRGRVASLLEVGTGFHPELTGRENIYLNGAINGMKKVEISKKLDEIVDFAGVQQFLDTPVKRYSSGMHVRLGFAVAAHLDSEILLVDEVLAVGDAAFQKKAIGKMKDVTKAEGRTVLFVSHNMESIRNLCQRGVVLSGGEVVQDGPVEKSINKYLGGIAEKSRKYGEVKWDKPQNAPGGDIIRIKSVKTKNNDGQVCSKFNISEKIIIEVEFWVLKNGYQVCNSLGFTYYSSKTLKVDGYFYLFDDYVKNLWGKQPEFKKGIYRSKLVLPSNLLNEGIFTMVSDIFIPPAGPDSSFQVRKHNVLSFDVIDDFNPKSARGSYPGDWQRGTDGYMFRPDADFTTELIYLENENIK